MIVIDIVDDLWKINYNVYLSSAQNATVLSVHQPWKRNIIYVGNSLGSFMAGSDITDTVYPVDSS